MTLRRERHLLKGPERRELTMTTVRIIGPGRAGLSFAAALTAVGVEVRGPLGRGDDVSPAAAGVGVLLLDSSRPEIAGVALAVKARSVDRRGSLLGGSRPRRARRPMSRVAALHPLVTLPDPVVGAARLGLRLLLRPGRGPGRRRPRRAALGGRSLQIPPDGEGRIPRRRLRCVQPPGGAPRPSTAHGRICRPSPRSLPAARPGGPR